MLSRAQQGTATFQGTATQLRQLSFPPERLSHDDRRDGVVEHIGWDNRHLLITKTDNCGVRGIASCFQSADMF